LKDCNCRIFCINKENNLQSFYNKKRESISSVIFEQALSPFFLDAEIIIKKGGGKFESNRFLMDGETKFYKSRRLRIAIESGNYQTQSKNQIEDLENFWNLEI